MCRIFTNDMWEDMSLNNEILHLGYYRKYRFPDGTVNPDFRKDMISGRILDLKDKDERAINYFFSEIDPEIERTGFTICVVPSHIASNCNDSGVAILAKRLANAGRKDGTQYLFRTKNIDKLSTGGSRDFDIILDSIRINPEVSVSGDIILLVDDVTTSGNSLLACRQRLLENGARRVAMFAIGQSI